MPYHAVLWAYPCPIGEILHISKKTVGRHLNGLYRAFHAGSREEMVALAWEMGLVTPKTFGFITKKRALAASRMGGGEKEMRQVLF